MPGARRAPRGAGPGPPQSWCLACRSKESRRRSTTSTASCVPSRPPLMLRHLCHLYALIRYHDPRRFPKSSLASGGFLVGSSLGWWPPWPDTATTPRTCGGNRFAATRSIRKRRGGGANIARTAGRQLEGLPGNLWRRLPCRERNRHLRLALWTCCGTTVVGRRVRHPLSKRDRRRRLRLWTCSTRRPVHARRERGRRSPRPRPRPRPWTHRWRWRGDWRPRTARARMRVSARCAPTRSLRGRSGPPHRLRRAGSPRRNGGFRRDSRRS